jgi:hypothetical protein
LLTINIERSTANPSSFQLRSAHSGFHALDDQISFEFRNGSDDGRSYAEDFLSVFKAIGWEVDGPETAHEPTGASSRTSPLIANNAGLPPCAEALHDALQIYGIEVEVECSGSGNVPNGTFLLRIGNAC